MQQVKFDIDVRFLHLSYVWNELAKELRKHVPDCLLQTFL
jgi:pyruvate carboxylase